VLAHSLSVVRATTEHMDRGISLDEAEFMRLVGMLTATQRVELAAVADAIYADQTLRARCVSCKKVPKVVSKS